MLFVVALLVSAPVLELDAELRDEFRVREHISGDLGNGRVAFDVQVEPGLGLRLAEPRWSLTVLYNPRFLAREPYARTHTEILHRAQIVFDAQLSRRLRVSVGEFFSYGDYDISSLVDVFNVQNGKIDSIPNVTTLRYVSTYATAQIAFQVNREVGLRMLGSFFDGGGADATARVAVPIQKEAREQLDISVLAARADALVTSFAATQDEFSTGQRYVGGEASELYQHRFSRFTELDLTAGLQIIEAQSTPGAHHRTDVFPEGIIAITHTVALAELGDVATVAPAATDAQQALELRADLSAGPYYDRTTGQVYERTGADVGMTYRFSRRWSLELRGGVVLSLKKPQATQDVIALGQLGFIYRIAPYMALEAGARELVEALVFVRGPPQEQWLTFFSFTWNVRQKV